jgi:hypothetical protein
VFIKASNDKLLSDTGFPADNDGQPGIRYLKDQFFDPFNIRTDTD